MHSFWCPKLSCSSLSIRRRSVPGPLAESKLHRHSGPCTECRGPVCTASPPHLQAPVDADSTGSYWKKSVCKWTRAVQTHALQGAAVSDTQIMRAGFLAVGGRRDNLGDEPMMVDWNQKHQIWTRDFNVHIQVDTDKYRCVCKCKSVNTHVFLSSVHFEGLRAIIHNTNEHAEFPDLGF